MGGKRRLMQYSIISGRTVETKRSWFPTGSDVKKQRGTRRAGTSSEKKIKANEKSCVLNLARTINCNFGAGDWFVTFKYDGSHYHDSTAPTSGERAEERYQAAKKIFTKKLLPKLRKRYETETGKKLRMVWVTANWSVHEKHPARIHHHAVLPADALEMATEIWNQFGGEGDTVQSRRLSDEGDYTKIAYYMVDNVHGRPENENRWSACRGMAKPIYTEPEPVTDIEAVEVLPNGIVKDVVRLEDEDGMIVSSYLRQTLKTPPKVRGGQIVLQRNKRRRRKGADE